AQYGAELRWYTVTGNDRPGPLGAMIKSEHNLLGFSDAGAHLRNMAFYNFPLRTLKFVKDASDRGKPILPLERLVHRLTGELGQWFDLDAGTLEVGKRADLVVIDPEALDHRVEEIHEEPMPEFGDTKRLVRRNPDVVSAVFVNGVQVVTDGMVHPEVGRSVKAGRFLRTRSAPPAAPRVSSRERAPVLLSA
ncbi:MAG: N-acyl-D-glutamate amidohydrolase, partial [Myxococcota bacterium]